MSAREFSLLKSFERKQTAEGIVESVCVNCSQSVVRGHTIDELSGREFLHTLLCLKRSKLAT